MHITLPQQTPANLAFILLFRRQLGDLSWTGNDADHDFHFCFANATDFGHAQARLATLRASLR